MRNQLHDKLESLLAKVKLGDRTAFKELYDLAAAKLTGVAFRIVGNKEVANELVQEAFIQIWRNSEQYQNQFSKPLTWMCSIVRYRAYDYIKTEGNRMEGRLRSAELEDIALVPNLAEDFVCGLSEQDALEKCMSLLDAEQQKSIMMAYYLGLSREEIAEHFKRTLNTMKSVIRRAVMRLQVCLNS